MRLWEATGPGTVALWWWTPSRGLRVMLRDGASCRSGWGSLRAFERAVQERREGPAREVTDPAEQRRLLADARRAGAGRHLRP
jgi:hypothetical protein